MLIAIVQNDKNEIVTTFHENVGVTNLLLG